MDIKPCCHHCENAHYVRKNGLSRAKSQRYFCNVCKKSFQTRYIYQGKESDIYRLIEKMLAEGESHENIASRLGIRLDMVSRYILAAVEDK
ncbi:transposase-like zinc-binding domain-containing protein [Budvicia diplopodorum]|uniref:transposase-like zinc-binding domain-containing protein n=1 Tax=Budvicia diplopodorum TaxID=1119056 RepID=UPI0013581AF6|nr:hypothetical protein [Budvicia diplopodorum]